MSIQLKMPALSPTMEKGSIARWLVKIGDEIRPGDMIVEIETDKATMEVEAVDEGFIVDILVPEGMDDVPVGTAIAVIGDAPAAEPAAATDLVQSSPPGPPAGEAQTLAVKPIGPTPLPVHTALSGGRTIASPLAKRIAAEKGIDLASITGTGPNGRILKADVLGTAGGGTRAVVAAPPLETSFPAAQGSGIPHVAEKLSSMRKTIARRLTESKQQVPHIYLTVDIRLDALLQLRKELNTTLEPQGIKLSINDLLIKALARSLIAVPECNVQFAGEQMLKFARADISVAVSIDGGLITPIIADASGKSVSAISTEMSEMAARARSGKLQPHEYQGGTASLSNMGMFGIRQFDAVINPPQAMIMAIGAGERRPFVIDDALSVATVMSATGSFDHRAIDGADAARLMQAFRQFVEQPFLLLA